MVFNNSAFRQAAVNTLTFSAVAVPLAVVLSLLLAMMLESRMPFKSQFRTFFKPYDGAYCIGGAYLAGIVPL